MCQGCHLANKMLCSVVLMKPPVEELWVLDQMVECVKFMSGVKQLSVFLHSPLIQVCICAEKPFSKVGSLFKFCSGRKDVHYIIQMPNVDKCFQACNHGLVNRFIVRQDLLEHMQQAWKQVLCFTCLGFQACKALMGLCSIRTNHGEPQVAQPWAHMMLHIKLLDSTKDCLESLAWWIFFVSLSHHQKNTGSGAKSLLSEIQPSGIEDMEAITPHHCSGHPRNRKKRVAAPFIKESLVRGHINISLLFFSQELHRFSFRTFFAFEGRLLPITLMTREFVLPMWQQQSVGKEFLVSLYRPNPTSVIAWC